MELDLKNYKNRHSSKSKLIRLIWNIIWLLFFRITPKKIFNPWRIFLLRLFGARIGKNCLIHPSCKVWLPENLSIGDWVALSDETYCYSVDKIIIGNSVTISREVFLCCASHDISSPIMELKNSPIIIKDNVWVAARAFIGPGVEIGEGAIIAACAVVTKDVPLWTVVAGNPAVHIKLRSIKK